MPTEDLWDNRYAGPRWTYAYTNRPHGPAHQPRGFVLMSTRPHPAYRHGTVDYPAKLSEKDVYDFELVLVGHTEGGNENR